MTVGRPTDITLLHTTPQTATARIHICVYIHVSVYAPFSAYNIYLYIYMFHISL